MDYDNLEEGAEEGDEDSVKEPPKSPVQVQLGPSHVDWKDSHLNGIFDAEPHDNSQSGTSGQSV